MKTASIRLLIVFVVVLLGSGLLVYVLLERSSRSDRNVVVDRPASTANQADSAAGTQSPTPAQDAGSDATLSELFGTNSAEATAPHAADRGVVATRIFLRFLMAAILATFLAFRWRRGPASKRNPYVAQTQILLAVVAAAMMIVVGDSAARAFGIFAAASLVRFRTNIRDPKETTVLLICLGVGLACGVGRLDMAAILMVFALLTLWILEYFESAQVFRSMEVTVGTRNITQTHQVLKNLIARYGLNGELRQLDHEDEQNGKIVYELNLGSTVNTDRLTEEMLAEDGNNISSLQWDQKKSKTYIYS